MEMFAEQSEVFVRLLKDLDFRALIIDRLLQQGDVPRLIDIEHHFSGRTMTDQIRSRR